MSFTCFKAMIEESDLSVIWPSLQTLTVGDVRFADIQKDSLAGCEATSVVGLAELRVRYIYGCELVEEELAWRFYGLVLPCACNGPKAQVLCACHASLEWLSLPGELGLLSFDSSLTWDCLRELYIEGFWPERHESTLLPVLLVLPHLRIASLRLYPSPGGILQTVVPNKVFPPTASNMFLPHLKKFELASLQAGLEELSLIEYPPPLRRHPLNIPCALAFFNIMAGVYLHALDDRFLSKWAGEQGGEGHGEGHGRGDDRAGRGVGNRTGSKGSEEEKRRRHAPPPSVIGSRMTGVCPKNDTVALLGLGGTTSGRGVTNRPPP
ncbi:hypothetical protein FB451DRAFT_1194125 [Mycena latifolia]|nr:hypothetical protein FB451DRAFT_1194125 [Mycena latifolia]